MITEQTLQKFKGSLVLLIGLLGQRFGTPTDSYGSGTEEEFATAMKFRGEQGGWPEVKWFFRENWGRQGMPVEAAKLLAASTQLEKVEMFKNRLQTQEPMFLTVDFPGTDDFQAIFSQDLRLWLHDPAHLWNRQANPATPAQPDPQVALGHLDTWLKALRKECARLPLPMLDGRMGMESASPIELPDIFVPLKAIPPQQNLARGRRRGFGFGTGDDAGYSQRTPAHYGTVAKPTPGGGAGRSGFGQIRFGQPTHLPVA